MSLGEDSVSTCFSHAQRGPNADKWNSVLAQVTATIVKPRDDRPYEGFLQITSEISPMASSVFEAGR